MAVDSRSTRQIDSTALAERAARAGLAAAPADWWTDAECGVALLAPEVAVARTDRVGGAAVAVRGTVRTDGRTEPPAGWPDLPPAEGAGRLLYDLLDRDVDAIRGMRGGFALAAWDGRRRRLLVARDHLGQRCVFTCQQDGLLMFSSDLPVLLGFRDRGTDMDLESAFWYLAFGTAAPGKTLIEGVRRIPAAHVLSWRPGGLAHVERYWTPLAPDAPAQATPDAVAAIRTVLDQAVLAAVDDRATGILLSGGVDSTYLAAASVAVAGIRPRTYTVEFEPECELNETEYAQAVARWLGLNNTLVQVLAPSALQVLGSVVLRAAEPCAAWASISQYLTVGTARQEGYPVLVSGLGADEIFGGYDQFRGYYARYLRYLGRPGSAAVAGGDPFEGLLLPGGADTARVLYPGVARFFDDPALRAALHPPFNRWRYDSQLRAFYRECRELKPQAHPMEMMVAHECQHRIPDLLHANFGPLERQQGVEVRHPFLDPDLIRMVAGLDAASRYRTRAGTFSLRYRDLQPNFKHAMLEVARGRIPAEIVDRPRKSFTAPFGAWMYHPAFGAAVESTLRGSSFWEVGLVRRAWLDTVLERTVPGPNPWVFQLWALLTLASWFDLHVAGKRLP